MLRAAHTDELRVVRDSWRQEGLTVALVPTMGNLHDGHLALVKEALQRADRVVVSIYVNPTQFGEGEDFDAYPRTLDADLRKLESAGAHLAFTPNDEAIYPHGKSGAVNLIAPRDLASVLEGEKRPGHFDGVVTVVCRLFNLVQPQFAVFGEKDFQQLQIIRRMTTDLGYDIEIISVPTVREPSGLAMSSRNNYLGSERRQQAAIIQDALERVVESIRSGKSDFSALEGKAAKWLKNSGLTVDYFCIRRQSDLQAPAQSDKDLVILVAAWSGDTRLIDNKITQRVCNY